MFLINFFKIIFYKIQKYIFYQQECDVCSLFYPANAVPFFYFIQFIPNGVIILKNWKKRNSMYICPSFFFMLAAWLLQTFKCFLKFPFVVRFLFSHLAPLISPISSHSPLPP